MLFSSYVFLFCFLPLAIVCFYALNRVSRTAALVGLIGFSLVYYGYWNYRYVPLLMASVVFNYTLGRMIQARTAASKRRAAQVLLAAGVAINVALLAYFKYAYFFAGWFGVADRLGTIVLPLAISFYTFQQIAWLVDSYRGIVEERRLLPYVVFVTFFPHLIAGPILHHREMMPQFADEARRRFRLENLAVGLSIFLLGLAKKVLIADNMAPYVTPVFAAAAGGAPIDFYTAWCAALSYTFQLYFDFSGYSDMAIGAARMFGLRVPANFFSPYQAVNIIDFWRRWHITLSRLLRDYLYIPLGGNRKGPVRRYVNLMITMLLGGLWHGAGWTFVMWGGLHGLYLVINHGWHAIKLRLGWTGRPSVASKTIAVGVTFVAVVVAWVFFRAQDAPTALHMLAAMSGINGISAPSRALMPPVLLDAALLLAVWFAPNTYQIMRAYAPAFVSDTLRDEKAPLVGLQWRPSFGWAAALACTMVASLIVMLSNRMEFLYYQF